MGIKIIATPDPATPELQGGGLERAIALIAQGARHFDHVHAGGWKSIQELIGQIDAVLNAAPNECLELLEIYAHGRPIQCNGITEATAPVLGQALKDRHQRLCDEVRVYLSGCNTGVRTEKSESIAQILSRHTPTEADHSVKVTVCGPVGYMRSNHMIGTATTRAELAEDGIVWCPAYPDVRDASGVVHPGSRAATGNDVWRCFREGNPV